MPTAGMEGRAKPPDRRVVGSHPSSPTHYRAKPFQPGWGKRRLGGACRLRNQREARDPMLINGKCHCGNISFSLDWPGETPEIPARACGCTFCVKHGGVWTSKSGATLNVRIHDPAASSKYTFGTATATFHVCSRCGVVPFVSSDIENRRYAVVNVNTFEGVDPSRLHRANANFEGEDVGSRLSRRARNWIDNVHIEEDLAVG